MLFAVAEFLVCLVSIQAQPVNSSVIVDLAGGRYHVSQNVLLVFIKKQNSNICSGDVNELGLGAPVQHSRVLESCHSIMYSNDKVGQTNCISYAVSTKQTGFYIKKLANILIVS